jgi:hypothetical protein
MNNCAAPLFQAAYPIATAKSGDRMKKNQS